MPSRIVKELNRGIFATRETTDITAVFAAYEIERQTQPVLINSIGYGGNTINTTDRSNYQSQWAAIIRNLSIDLSYSLLNSIAPINLPPGADIMWIDMINGLNGNVHRNFSQPFVLPPGDKYHIITVSPYINVGINAAIYFYLSINAELANPAFENIQSGWKLK